MKNCPAPRCGVEIRSMYLCCSKHWYTIPDFYRDRLADAYYDLKKELISFEDVRRAEAETCDQMGWDRPLELVTAGCNISKKVCRRCGKVSLFAYRPDGSGHVPVDEVRAGAAAAAAASGTALVVVGFFALLASENPGAYAHFVEHACGVNHD